MSDDHVTVRMLRVGSCGTDAEINHGLYGKPPDGEEFLILGHENLGVVADVGKNVTGFAAGRSRSLNRAAALRRVSELRRGVRTTCCSSGKYTELGHHVSPRLHGGVLRRGAGVPAQDSQRSGAFGVLLEPMSVVEKGIDHAFLLQRRLRLGAQAGVVLGGGPVGLLAAAVLRARGLRTVVFGREPAPDLRAQIAMQLGARVLSVDEALASSICREQIGRPDIIVPKPPAKRKRRLRCDGDPATRTACSACSASPAARAEAEPIDRINQLLVLGNQVVFGSVNANPRHFAKGVEDFVTIERNWPGALSRLLTNRIPWQDFNSWFTQRGSGIKTTLEIGS